MSEQTRRLLEDTAFVFPGQGSQQAGMGEPFYEAWPETRKAFEGLETTLEVDLRSLCFDGSAEQLREPRNTQPAMLAAGYATYVGLTARLEVEPAYLAGHSLGHFTALAAAGAAEPAAFAEVVRKRGEFMERAESERGPGTMVAILLADPENVANACEGRADVGVALKNGPRQTVISGTIEGVAAVRDDLEDRTRARFRELEVGAAFHSPVMAPAVKPVEAVMADLEMSEAEIPVVSDVSGEVYTDPAVARRDLTTQITSAVDWVGVIEELSRRGIERYVEFPPAGILSTLIERIDPDAECVVLETPADAEGVLA